LVLTKVAKDGTSPEPFTGALVLINGDPELAAVVVPLVSTGALVLTKLPEGEPLVPEPFTGALVLTNGDPELAAVVVPLVGLVLPTGALVLTKVPEEGEPAVPAAVELPATCDAWAELL
jgi:hypothetical protein